MARCGVVFLRPRGANHLKKVCTRTAGRRGQTRPLPWPLGPPCLQSPSGPISKNHGLWMCSIACNCVFLCAKSRVAIANIPGDASVLFAVRPRCLLLAVLVAGAGVVPSPGFAQKSTEEDHPFFVRLGYGMASYRTTGRASVAGQPVDGARVALGDVRFLALELGWRFAPDWSVSFLGGLPPTVTLHGRGDFAAQGMLRKVTYGSLALGVQYHPLVFGRFEPYVGAGINYTFILRTYGGSMSELHVADTAGPYLQVGGQYRLADRVSVFADIRKTWLTFGARGTAGSLPVRVSIEPDPLTGTLGLSFAF